MAKDRSFKEYISKRFYNELFEAVSGYVETNFDKLDLYSYNDRSDNTVALSDIQVKTVNVSDLPEMKIAFDVIIEAEIEVYKEDRYHDTDEDIKTQWFIAKAVGDLEKQLNDVVFSEVHIYHKSKGLDKPLSDALVPYLYADKTEEAATDFLKRNYPLAIGNPIAIDVKQLALNMGLTIETAHLSKDFSVFGQICFDDCDIEVYDENGNPQLKHYKAKTIIVEPKAFLLRNLGSVNNTIVHECVHWDRHRKAFMLERLFNEDASQIKCLVIGGIKDTSVRSATDWMEWQANVLAPKIQMPLTSFKQKANEFIRDYRRTYGDVPMVDIMEPVIEQLATYFVVSKQAAKIRMIDAGFEEAIGAFTYIDNAYVKPHAFKKGTLQRNQTYCIGVEEAAFIDFSDTKLHEQIEKGTYVYIDTHFCLNSPKYIEKDECGNVQMTEYARLHVDECCLAFELKIKSKSKYAEEFYKECVLFRDADSGIEFQTVFPPDINDDLMAKGDALMAEERKNLDIIHNMPEGFGDALIYMMNYMKISVEALAEQARMDTKKIQRMRNNPDYPKDIESVIAVCVAMHLNPQISKALLEKSGFSLKLGQSDAHLLYNSFLTKCFMWSVDDCNDLLLAKGFKALSGAE